MTQRQPGDYVINAELTDEQRERFVKDCVAAGAYVSHMNEADTQDLVGWCKNMGVRPRNYIFTGITYARNVTQEYKDNPMTQPQLMRQIADAMERNPDGWWREFEHFDRGGVWSPCHSSRDALLPLTDGRRVRPKPRTYTLYVEDMPIHGDPFATFSKAVGAPGQVLEIRVNVPDEPTAREALEKLTKAMGGGND